LDVAFLKKYVEPLQQLCFKHILELTDEELKNEDKKILAEIILQFDILLRQVTRIGWLKGPLLTTILGFAHLKSQHEN